LINDVLDLSKIEAGRLEVDLAPCDLHRLLQSVSDIISQRSEEKGLAFALDVSPEVPQGIITDATKLRQVLVNLLGNSVKFTEEGSISLRVKESVDKRLEFAVQDSGIGMTPEELAEVFDPFTQAEGGKVSGGTGLGLAISQRIVSALDGELEVESERGQGTCFTILHPLTEVDDLDLKELAAEPLTEERDYVLAPGQDITVLVADDRKVNRDILVQLLETAGFQTMEAVNGKEALEQLREHRLPLVLMDVRMPIINGIEATREIRNDPALRDKVVIAVSASVFPDFQEKIKEVGCDDFIGKPFRASEVFRKIERHLKVQYIEQEKEEPGVVKRDDLPPLPEDVPKDIAQRLRQAADLGDVTELNRIGAELIAGPAGASHYGAEISRLTTAFDFDGIKELANDLEKKGNE
jgi:CheY-like chemotaxis protein/anti-sigma regulatory factor (Ser/Thr protein kinase)